MNYHQKFVRACLLFTMIGVWVIAGLLFARIKYEVAHWKEIEGSLDLIREGQYMSDEEWEAYCKMFPEDCEETY